MATSLCCRVCASPTPDELTARQLIGDIFFNYTCANCTADRQPRLERLSMGWVSIIHLVLYHLHRSTPGGSGFFRWKEDICRLIEERWDDLCPNRPKSSNWLNSISSILSANSSIFESGFTALKQSGWWALRDVAAPRLPDPSSESKKKRPLPPSASAAGAEEHSAAAAALAKRTKVGAGDTTASGLDPHGRAAVEAANEIKRKLVERLLKVDSSLLKAALSKDVAHGGPGAHAKPLNPIMYIPPGTGAGHLAAAPKRPAAAPADAAGAKRDPGAPPGKKKLKPANYIRASPHENELLEVCNRIAAPDEQIRRLKRKLAVRRTKRMNGSGVFDLDNQIYLYLKQTEPLRVTADSAARLLEGLGADTGGPPDAAQTQAMVTAELNDVPFLRDPGLSFRAKLDGVSSLEGYPFAIESPYSGTRLPAYVSRETARLPPRLALLHAIRDRAGAAVGPPSLGPVDIMHLRREHVAQLNRLLQRFFWPAVDISESLGWPEFSLVLMYRKLVVGCALCTPEGYLSYLFVHPDFRQTGLATRLLYHLVRQLPASRDVTAHVAAGNPAMMLYQRFGFKPEEFIVDFYAGRFRQPGLSENALPEPAERNALFLRLRR